MEVSESPTSHQRHFHQTTGGGRLVVELVLRKRHPPKDFFGFVRTGADGNRHGDGARCAFALFAGAGVVEINLGFGIVGVGVGGQLVFFDRSLPISLSKGFCGFFFLRDALGIGRRKQDFFPLGNVLTVGRALADYIRTADGEAVSTPLSRSG